MKPITHPLAVAYMEAIRDKCDPLPALMQWRDAGFPLYVDPAPMPEPALGMRVWTEHEPHPGKRELRSDDIRWLRYNDCTWGEGSMPAAESICMITDYRTNAVIWERK